jgi:hypothetical protein
MHARTHTLTYRLQALGTTTGLVFADSVHCEVRRLHGKLQNCLRAWPVQASMLLLATRNSSATAQLQIR